MNSQMSVNEILNSVKGLELSKFEQFYRDLTALRIQKNGTSSLNSIESQLLITINTEFDPKKWERLTYLDWKLEFGDLTTKEEAESLKLAEAYENFSVERLKCLSQLALLRRVSIDALMEQLGVNSRFNG
jgi:hypothetical protein